MSDATKKPYLASTSIGPMRKIFLQPANSRPIQIFADEKHVIVLDIFSPMQMFILQKIKMFINK